MKDCQSQIKKWTFSIFNYFKNKNSSKNVHSSLKQMRDLKNFLNKIQVGKEVKTVIQDFIKKLNKRASLSKV